MELLRSKSLLCPVDQHCSQWARKLMGYCLCGKRDMLSLDLGVISVVSWCVAEVPQLVTNYRSKSAEGLSILFLTTWIVGDALNLFGCILEPATVSLLMCSAFYLYTITTLILFSQAIYYGHVYPRLKSNRKHEASQAGPGERRTGQICVVDTKKADNLETAGFAPSSPIPVEYYSPDSSGELFFMSARSLSVCHTPPPLGSFLASRASNSEIEPNLLEEPLLGEVSSSQSAPPPKVKTMLCVVSLMTFVLMESLKNNTVFKSPTEGIVLRVGRQLLQATRSSTQETLSAESNGIGTYFGWGMAAIYMGGRLPQICLNGLNPLMFVFALVGNSTYVASILVNSLNWSKIQPNLPWLVESGGCVLLDIFILVQFFYYQYRSRTKVEKHVS
ncbi:PQ-loop repeat family protein / transmembrane family protein [Striga hermonthica]|uniref:PQ-loop repeat family protein / transmembrane family protein n=1 Tax=Striga hermonthica TaxID=68872 RepID=A0A9N7R3Q4_STRHE|nr:PQ-loop repeat family protein / transmembrane family protein [Striga hermonthica]